MEMPSFPTVHLKVEYPHGAHKRWQVREDVSFGELLQAILDKYPGRRPPMMGPLGLLYEDEEGDFVVCSDDEDWDEAKRVHRTNERGPFHLKAIWLEHSSPENHQQAAWRRRHPFRCVLEKVFGGIKQAFQHRKSHSCSMGAPSCCTKDEEEGDHEERNPGWLLQKQLEELGLDGDLICDLKQQLQGNPGQSVLDQVTSLFSATVGPHSQPDQKDGAPSSSSEASSSTQTAASPSKAGEEEKEEETAVPSAPSEHQVGDHDLDGHQKEEEGVEEGGQESQQSADEEEASLTSLYEMFDGLGVSRELVKFMVRERRGDVSQAASDILEVLRSSAGRR